MTVIYILKVDTTCQIVFIYLSNLVADDLRQHFKDFHPPVEKYLLDKNKRFMTPCGKASAIYPRTEV